MVNYVHPTALLGRGVELGEGVTVGPHAVLIGPVTVADDCWIGPATVIGSPPEITGVDHPHSYEAISPYRGISIGRGTIIREQVTVHQGSERVTTVGAQCYIMNKTHVAHDCELGDRVVLSTGACLGGHVAIGANANVGLGAVVHQRRVIGSGAMIGMGSVVTRDLPPYALATGSPCRIRGVNEVGMQRRGFAAGDIDELATIYRSGAIPTAETAPPATAPEFAWWLQRATRAPAAGPPSH